MKDSLKPIFQNIDRKRQKRKRTSSFPKQEMFQFVLSRETLQMTFTTGFSKQTLKTWQHVCLQVKSHVAADVNWTLHVPLPALNINESPAAHERLYIFA